MTDHSSEAKLDLFAYLCQLGDDRLILGHRLSEWCGHAHDLEDDIALANVALDMIGQAEFFLRAAGEIEDKGRNEDTLAYLRDDLDYKNCQLVELPRGDFAFTICRSVVFDIYSELLFSSLLMSTDEQLAGFAGRCLKEVRYHMRYSCGWFVRLGDGTEESKRRLQSHLDVVWGYCGELFQDQPEHVRLAEAGVAPLPSSLKDSWEEQFRTLAQKATLTLPEAPFEVHTGGRNGFHTEHLGHLLSEMQILPRSHPEATW